MTQICHYKKLKQYDKMGYSWGALLPQTPLGFVPKVIYNIESLCGDTTITEVNIHLV